MRIYESETGRVDQGLLLGIRFRLSNGYVVKATPWMKHRMGELHAALKVRGLNPFDDGPVKTAFWEYFLDLAHSPPNGLRHRAEAEEPIDDLVAAIVAAAQ